MSASKEKAPPVKDGAKQEVSEGNEAAMTVKPSWRNFYDVHPAAEVFHKLSTPEQLKELAEDIAAQETILAPIHTASVALERRSFVIDGVSRLNALEATGKQIVNEKGEWTGMLAATGVGRNMVIHHPGLKHQQVAKLVISLNAKRRHMSKEQLAQAIVAVVKAEAKEFSASVGGKLASRRGRVGEGRPKDTIRTEALKRATDAGISKRTTERALAGLTKKEMDDLISGKANQKAKAKVAPSTLRKKKKEPPFEEIVWRRWTDFVVFWAPAQRREAKEVIDFCLKRDNAEDVIRRWSSFLQRWSPAQRLQVKDLIRNFLRSPSVINE